MLESDQSTPAKALVKTRDQQHDDSHRIKRSANRRLMMESNTLKKVAPSALRVPGSVALPATRRVFAGSEGWLTVQGSRAWLTRDGDPVDYVLEPGERLPLWQGDVVTAESWCANQASWLEWRPVHQPLPAARLGGALATALARGARGLAGGLLALARSAEASACRAQGNICAGDSMASAGALQ
jgi:hypothetical protein